VQQIQKPESPPSQSDESAAEERESFEGTYVGEEEEFFVMIADTGERVRVSKKVSSNVPVPVLKSGYRVNVTYRGAFEETIRAVEAIYFIRDTVDEQRERRLYESEFVLTKKLYDEEDENSLYYEMLATTRTKKDKNENRYCAAKIISNEAQLDRFLNPEDSNMRYFTDVYRSEKQRYAAKYNATFFAQKAVLAFNKDLVHPDTEFRVIGDRVDGKTYHLIVGEITYDRSAPYVKTKTALMMAEIPRDVLATCNKFVVDWRFADHTRIIAKTDSEITVDSRLYQIQRSEGSLCFQDTTVFEMENTEGLSVGDEVIVAHTGKFVKEDPWRGELLDVQIIS